MPSTRQPGSAEQPPGLCAELSPWQQRERCSKSHSDTVHVALGSAARAAPGPPESDISQVLPFVAWEYSGIICMCYILCVTVHARFHNRVVWSQQRSQGQPSTWQTQLESSRELGHPRLDLAVLGMLQGCHSAELRLVIWHFKKLDILTAGWLGLLSEGSTQLGQALCSPSCWCGLQCCRPDLCMPCKVQWSPTSSLCNPTNRLGLQCSSRRAWFEEGMAILPSNLLYTVHLLPWPCLQCCSPDRDPLALLPAGPKTLGFTG